MSTGERHDRIQKIENIRDLGVNPYASGFGITQKDGTYMSEKNNIIELLDYNSDLKDFNNLQQDGTENRFKIAGRVSLKREHGKLIFARLRDYSGEIQIAFVKDSFKLFSEGKEVNTDAFEFVKKLVDMGDFVGAEGDLFVTKHGEKTLFVNNFHFLSKTVRPLPEKFHGLGDDKEDRYRYRYLDFIVSDEQGEQTELEFLKENEKFKDFFVNLFKDEAHKEWIENVQKVVKFRVEKMEEEVPDIIKKFYQSENIFADTYFHENFQRNITDFYNYMFNLFQKSNKVRDYVMELMSIHMKPYYLAARYKMNTQLRFLTRSKAMKFMRDYLDNYNFMEVETPVLTNKASGALATPFSTYHEGYDMEAYLRIAPETYLKRSMVGGIEKVYEFARCFRNEGSDPSHIQDFTMLEFYWAYVDYNYLMDFTENMLKSMLDSVFGSRKLIILDKEGEAKEVDFNKEWPRVSIFQLIEPYFPELEKLWKEDNLGQAKELAKEKLDNYIENSEKDELMNLGWGNLIDFIYKKTARKKLVEPVFVVNHPLDVSPLARKNDEDGKVVDRFQLVINGWEVVNAYSELIDPVDQMERFMSQQQSREAGDDEAHEIDKSYVRAMEHGMPPMAGWGSGIDRLIALLTTQENIRDVVMFPLLKEGEEF